jgi:putative membrane protein
MMYYWPDHDLSAWGWIAMATGMLLFWGLLILFGVLLVRALNRPAEGPSGSARPSPQQILAERFARGEIDEEEYGRRTEALTDPGHLVSR